MLKLKAFHPASDKVRQAEFHPTQPWVVSATKSHHVCVWDWVTQQTILEVQLGGMGEVRELVQDVDITRLHARDGSFAPNPSALALVGGRPGAATGLGFGSGSGPLRDARFLDLDVAQAQMTRQHLMVQGSGTTPPCASGVTSLAGQRLLVLVCENKVLLHDLASQRNTEVSKAVLEGKSPTCVAFLFLGGVTAPGRSSLLMASPLLALGCVDGGVRLVRLSNLQLISKLTPSAKSPVSCLFSHGVRGSPWEALVSGHVNGTLAAWEPLSKPPSVAVGLPPRVEGKAHDKEVVGVLLVAVKEGADENTRVLVSTGLDNRMHALDPVTLKECLGLAKMKLDPKAQATCTAHCPRGFSASGVNTLVIGTDLGVLFTINPATGVMRIVCNLADMIPVGTKKNPKVYGVCCHPLLPQYILAATNTGTALLAVEVLPTLAVAPLPLNSPQHAHTPPPDGTSFGEAVGSGATYVVAVGDALRCVTAAALAQQANTPLHNPRVQIMGDLLLAKGQPGGRAVVCASHDGSYVSVVWAAARTYAVFAQGAAAWTE
ncbi:MAG: hypothetical protein WDW36_008676 [Sanguina aurantia]